MSIGEDLAAARERAGMTTAQLSERTRIREVIIARAEENDFAAFGGDFYARGHLRAMAKAVGLDPDVIVQQYDDHYGGADPLPNAASMFKLDQPINLRERRKPNWTMAMGVALAIVAVFGVVRVMGGPAAEPERPVAATVPAPASVRPSAASPSPRPVEVKPAQAAATDQVTLLIAAKRNAYVQIRDAKNKRLFAGTIRKGDAQVFTAKSKIKLVVGNAGAVTLMVNGKNLGTPGRVGKSFKRTFGPGVPRPR